MMALRASLIVLMSVIGVVCAVTDGTRLQQAISGPHVRLLVLDERGWPLAGVRVTDVVNGRIEHTDVWGLAFVETSEPIRLAIGKHGYVSHQAYFTPGDRQVVLYSARRAD